jgi:DNA polymerase
MWLRQFRSKTYGTWLFDESADIFFDELPHWDGYRPAPNSIQYTTCNKVNADLVQAFAHLSGRVASLKLKKVNEAREHWLPSYNVSVWLTPGNCHEISKKPTITDFKGKVFCAQTQSGYFLVRREGRVWVTGNSGRLIQMQNLRRNSIEDLAVARELVKGGDYEAVKLLYGNVPDTLSQLVRTAFIPRKGYRFIVSDFSAIEARVLSWLAGESWRMDIFAEDGDIYCATASRMFHCPVTKHGENGHLRQKGKQAELACIAEGQMVLTDQGLIPIESVTTDQLLWDGEDWVKHEGVICKGMRSVITYGGITATADHLVWVEGIGKPVQLGFAAKCGSHLVSTADGEKAIVFGSHQGKRKAHDSNDALKELGSSKVYDILNAGEHHRFTVSGILVHNCGYGGSVGALKAMGALESGMTEDELKPLVDAWRQSNPNIVQLWWDVDKAALDAVREEIPTEMHNLTFSYEGNGLFITLPSTRKLAYVRPKIETNDFGSDCITYEGTGSTKKWERIGTYGPKLVENCTQAISRDLLCHAMQQLEADGCRIVMHIHDEVVIEAPKDMDVQDICSRMSSTPPWAEDLHLNADGYETDFYKKD